MKKVNMNSVDITDLHFMAKAFIDYFSSVLVSTDDLPQEYFLSNIEKPDLIVTEEGIFSGLLHLDSEKSPGPGGIPNAFLFRNAEWCSKFLVVIFKESILQGQVPEN